jgi:hypothetical protein
VADARIVITRPNSTAASLPTGVETRLVEQVAEAVDVARRGQVAERQRLIVSQRAGQEGERGVLGARNRDLPSRRLPPCDDTVHGRCLNRLRAGRKGRAVTRNVQGLSDHMRMCDR